MGTVVEQRWSVADAGIEVGCRAVNGLELQRAPALASTTASIECGWIVVSTLDGHAGSAAFKL